MDTNQACPECGILLPFVPEAAGKQLHCHACHTDFPAPITPISAGDEQGDYIIDSKLGSGSVSDVFVATKKSTGECVRMKILSQNATRNSDLTKRCLHIVMKTQKCPAPEIPDILEVGQIFGHIYMTTPYIEGICIDQFLAENGPVEDADGYDLVERLIGILKRLWHNHQHVHRNLSPGNILLTPERELFLLDAGFDKRMLVNTSEELNALNTNGLLNCFTAPELSSGLPSPGPSVDVYSIGAILYALICGLPPIASESLGSTTKLIKRASRDTGIPLSRQTTSFIRKLMNPNEGLRPTDWQDVETLLPDHSRSPQSRPDHTAATAIPPTRTSGAKTLLWALAFGLAIFLISAVVIIIQFSKPPVMSVSTENAEIATPPTTPPKSPPKPQKIPVAPPQPAAAVIPEPKEPISQKESDFPEITAFNIVHPDSGRLIRTLNQGDRIKIGDLPKDIAIVAKANNRTQSVKFTTWLGPQTESTRPYSLRGDVRGVHKPWTVIAGKYKFTATPYPENNAKGRKGHKRTVVFYICE